MVIADAIAHAINHRSCSLPTGRWKSWRQSWYKSRLIWRIWRILWFRIGYKSLIKKVHEDLDEKEHQDHQQEGKFWRWWSAGIISSFVVKCNKLGVTSQMFLPECNHCPPTRVKCGTEKVEFSFRTNRHAKLVFNGFSRGAPRQWIHRWPQRCRKRHWVPWSNMQHWKCIFGKKWRRRTAICGENFAAISDRFPWRINCCPGPKDSHLLVACWTSAVPFFGKLLITGPAMVANARLWSFNPSSRSSIQFVANAASSFKLRLARSRKSLFNACCRYWGAWTFTAFALDTQSHRIVRTCHPFWIHSLTRDWSWF